MLKDLFDKMYLMMNIVKGVILESPSHLFSCLYFCLSFHSFQYTDMLALAIFCVAPEDKTQKKQTNIIKTL